MWCSTHEAGSLRVTCFIYRPLLTGVQADVSELLLERLAMLCNVEGEEAALPQLILGQFRWWVRHTLCPLPSCTVDAFALLYAGARLLMSLIPCPALVLPCTAP